MELPDLYELQPDPEAEEFYNFDANCEAIAKKRDCIVVYPEHNQIQLDLDDASAYEKFERRLLELEERGMLPFDLGREEYVSRSGKGKHVTLTFPDKYFDKYERIAWQVMLGSDPVREAINTMRLASGIDRATRLFKPTREVKEK